MKLISKKSVTTYHYEQKWGRRGGVRLIDKVLLKHPTGEIRIQGSSGFTKKSWVSVEVVDE